MRANLGDPTPLLGHLRVLRRRKWLVLLSLVLVPVAAVVASQQQEDVYEASSEVLLSNQDLAANLVGIPDRTASQAPDRLAETQANLARVPEVVRRVLAEAGVTGLDVEDFLDESEVEPRPNADLLRFQVRHGDERTAVRLATEYARQFTAYRLELDTAALRRAAAELEERLSELGATEDDRSSGLYASLLDKQQQLRTLEALQTSNATVVREADEAEQVQPRPLRNGALGAALGLLLGIALAFLRDALDTRVSAEELRDGLGLPLLGRLPRPPRLRGDRRLAMVEEPGSYFAESVRMLRTNLEFVNLERGARTIMITSALEGEGKSTTAANLAAALAAAGRRVALVDLDLRRPTLEQFFRLDRIPGITDVALGRMALERTLSSVHPAAFRGAAAGSAGNGDGAGGSLEVLPAGVLPPNPGEFMGTQAISDVLQALKQRADVIVVDAPPLLPVTDPLVLSRHVDAIVLVSRLNFVRRPMVEEIHRLLEGSPAETLGFVLIDSQPESGQAYSRYYARPRRRQAAEEPVA